MLDEPKGGSGKIAQSEMLSPARTCNRIKAAGMLTDSEHKLCEHVHTTRVKQADSNETHFASLHCQKSLLQTQGMPRQEVRGHAHPDTGIVALHITTHDIREAQRTQCCRSGSRRYIRLAKQRSHILSDKPQKTASVLPVSQWRAPYH